MRHLQAAGGAPLTSGAVPRRTALLWLVAVVVVALDLLSKVLVVARLEGEEPIRLLGGVLLLRVSRNTGAAFSLAEGATPLLTVIAVGVVLVIAYTARRVRNLPWAVSLGMLLGGAAGNLVDRLFRAPGPGRGGVVDFLDLRFWPSFNLADSAIVCGGALLVVLSLRDVPLDGARAPDAGTQQS